MSVMNGSFRSLFVAALGLPAVALVGCGTDDGDSGGSSSVGSDTGEGATSEGESGEETGTPETCGGPDFETAGSPGEGQYTGCIPAPADGECTTCGDIDCRDALISEISEGASLLCPADLIEMVCIPEAPVDGQCCYSVTLEEDCDDSGSGTGPIFDGRPFMVDGVPREPGLCAREDWRASLVPRTAGLSGTTRRLLAGEWTRRARAEHASVASFARFTLELLALGAPPELVEAAQRAAGDEIRHAQVAFALASAYAGEAIGPSEIDIAGAVVSTSLERAAVACVREGCIGETLAAAAASVEARRAQDPVVREALLTIADEELSHAELAWRFVAWALERGGESVASAVRAAFGSSEGQVAHGTGDPDLSSHGCLSPAARSVLVARIRETVIEPAAASMLAGGTPTSSRAPAARPLA